VDSREELSKQISASSSNKSSVSLPEIRYERKRLEKIIKYVSLSNGHKKETAEFLDTIDKEVALLRQYQAEELLSDFYPQMRATVDKINGAATSLYQIIENYDGTAVSSLRKVIAESFDSFEKELKHRLAMPSHVRDELERKTKMLYAQQSYVARSPAVQDVLMQHLRGIAALLKRPGEPSPRCYISYAWPSIENNDKEYWIQPFLYILYEHLKAAGIDIVMDVHNINPGESIFQFMGQYKKNGNHIILVGSESLLQKHYSDISHAVKTELSIITSKSDEDKKLGMGSKIYPMLISGTIPSSYPEIYSMYKTVEDARDGHDVSYLELIEKLVDWLHHNQLNNHQDLKLKEAYVNKWKTFNTAYKAQGGLTNQANAAEVAAEVELNYHKQRLDYLRQDLNYQALKVQEEVEYSAVTNTKIVGALMESRGINPQNLWDAAGRQYQRPTTNAHFIPREALQAKINAHFKGKDQQILTLTAHGMGGMGKTTLASHYFQHPPHPYTIRAWFNAGSREQIYQQYLDLIKRVENIEYPKEMPIEEQAQRVKQWLEKQKDCLLVFDNVEKVEDLEGLLPEQGKHHILITSRNEGAWPINQSLDVDVMTIDESIDLIVKITGINKTNEKNLSKLKILVNTLGCLPLALAQAGAYMKVRKKTIDDYLLDYKSSQSSVLKVKTSMSPKHEPIWVTFDMNFKALQEDCPAALQTLKQASWLAASNIQYYLLISLIDAEKLVILKTPGTSLLWGEIVENIGKYSLMRFDTERHLINIHPLLQDILRSKQTEEEQIKTFIHICRWMFTLITNKETLDLDYRIFRPHAMRLFQHYDHITKVVKEIDCEDISCFLEGIKINLERAGTIFYIKLDGIEGLERLNGMKLEADFLSPVSPRTRSWFIEETKKSFPGHSIIEHPDHPNAVFLQSPAFIPEESDYIEPDTNAQVLAESAINNAHKHHSCLLQEQDLPENKTKLQKNAATAAIWQAENQENANEFRVALENTNITSGSKRIKIEEAGIVNKAYCIEPETQSQANINLGKTNTNNNDDLLNNLNENTLVGANTNLSISQSPLGISQLIEDSQNINMGDMSGNFQGAIADENNFFPSLRRKKKTNKNVTQTKGPAVVSNGHTLLPSISSLSESFANTAKNIENAARQIPRQMLFRQGMTEATRGLSQFITIAGRTGIVNSLQQLARSGCSPDGTSRVRPWFSS